MMLNEHPTIQLIYINLKCLEEIEFIDYLHQHPILMRKCNLVPIVSEREKITFLHANISKRCLGV